MSDELSSFNPDLEIPPGLASLGALITQGVPPLYNSRTFFFHPEDTRNDGEIRITIQVREDLEKEWVMIGPGGKKFGFPPGEYVLTFRKHSPQQLVSLKINPDPGGGRVP